MYKKLLLSVSVVLLPAVASGAPHTIFEPLVLLNDRREVTACGSVIHTRDASGTGVRIRLMVERNAIGPLTVMTVELAPGEPRADTPIKSATLHLRGNETTAGLQPVSGPGSNAFRAQAHQPGDEQGALFRGLMLAGGHIEVVLNNDARLRFDIAGPAPSNVFRHYLACTGDLYGPQ
ncbi:MAG: hypothetical protein OES09_04155 [Gammaproteobacteria bacterium]|nr:hypothetical protein [Gammaproteobacteria bacterium]